MGRSVDIIRRFPRFVGVNIIGTVVDTTVLWIFSTFVFSTYVGDYIISPIISFECAVFANYICSYYFIWRDRIASCSVKAFFVRYFFYNISSSLVFMLKMGILLLLEMIFGWNVVICNLAALCISGLINFSMGEWVIFRQKRK